MGAAARIYRLYDLLLLSEEELCLSAYRAEVGARKREVPADIWRYREALVEPFPGECIHDVFDYKGGPRLQVYLGEEGEIFFSYGDMRVHWSQIGRSIVLEKGTELEMRAGVVLERVVAPIAFLLERPELVALHASAVSTSDRQAWIFLGNSGVGKSTTALELVRRGMSLLADDLVLVEVTEARLLAATPTLRLFDPPAEIPEALAKELVLPEVEKYWYQFPERVEERIEFPLAGAISLEPDRDCRSPRCEQIYGSEAAVRILSQGFDLTDGPEAFRLRRFQRLCQLARSVPLYRLCYAMEDRQAPQQVEAILKWIGEAHG